MCILLSSNLHLRQKVEVTWLPFLLCIRETTGLHLGPEDRLSWLIFFVAFLSTPRKIPEAHLKLDHDHFFSIHYSIISSSLDVIRAVFKPQINIYTSGSQILYFLGVLHAKLTMGFVSPIHVTCQTTTCVA
jgi:hypothetical protein